MESLREYYAILGIQPGASLEQVKQAYEAAEQHLHAQRHANSALVRGKAQARLKVINEAYLAIIDTYEEVQASICELKDHRHQVREGTEPLLRTATAAKGQKGPSPAATAVDKTGVGRYEAKDGLILSPVEIDGEPAPDPAKLLKKEIILFLAVLAALLPMLLVGRCRPDQGESPPSARNDSAAPAEMAGQNGGEARNAPAIRQAPPDAASVRRDAERGNAAAQAVLGYLYASGTSVRRDPAEAARWYARAAAQGDAEAQDWLGYLYETGEGVTRDYAQAARWYRLAAEQGNADAEKNLGLLYAKGHGVARNRQEAVKWLHRAAAQGNDDARQTLREWRGE